MRAAPTGATEVDVLVVGAGPVGLTARALLERWGVRTLSVEKHGELSPFPRSRLVNVRSMEIFRQLGLTTAIRSRAFSRDHGRVRFRDTMVDHDFATAAMAGVDAPIAASPEMGVVTSQDRLEPTLLAAARAPLRFHVELVDLAEEGEAVTATLLDRGNNERSRVRARWVLAADGANSTVRQRLGIGTTGPGAMGRFTTVVFDADLGPWCSEQPAGVYFTAHGSFLPLYPEGGWAWFAPTPEAGDIGDHDWSGLLARAIGQDSGLRAGISVRRVQHWTMNAFVADRFRRGRVLLAGDAAHAVPILGGLGMNAGLADVHNLCWKLAGVVHGWAGPELVATYEAERRPAAVLTLDEATANTRLAARAQQRRREQLRSGAGASAAVEVPWSPRYFAQLGLVLGVDYRSTAVLADSGPDTAPERGVPSTDYVPTTRPGHRMPHLRLTDGRSTLDALGPWFTLLTPDPAQAQRPLDGPWPLRVETLPPEHAEPCSLSPAGALLIRPDGHVGARWRDRAPSAPALHHALAAITGSRADRP